ncbi:hypothetical protein LJC33_09165 [Eubacteriales bacterium OttesenSCG-928-N13]|nr:hypothetical protein [Eubacteriales bacterium OttesenSCG-928-N13]
METYFYRCPVCGFVYQVPDYWVSYAPEPQMEFPHLNLASGASCPCETLDLQESQASI